MFVEKRKIIEVEKSREGKCECECACAVKQSLLQYLWKEEYLQKNEEREKVGSEIWLSRRRRPFTRFKE